MIAEKPSGGAAKALAAKAPALAETPASVRVVAKPAPVSEPATAARSATPATGDSGAVEIASRQVAAAPAPVVRAPSPEAPPAVAVMSVTAASTPVAPTAQPTLFDWLTALSKQFQTLFFNVTPTVAVRPRENVTQADGTITGKVYGYDADGDPLVYTAGKPANGGSVVIDASGNFRYTPAVTTAGTARVDAFDVVVSEANSASHFHGLLGFFDRSYGSTVTLSVTVAIPATTPSPPSPNPPTPPPPTPNPPTPNPPSQTSSVPMTGDTTAALQAIFDRMKAGDTLTLDRDRVYQHSGVLKIRVAGVNIVGNGATLQATKDTTSSVQILADNVTISNLTLTAPSQGPRYEALEQHKLVITGKGVTVADVTIKGSAAAGVFVYGATDFTLDRVHVMNTRADGIHMTNGANNGTVNDAVISATGDDGIAVVSYLGDGRISHDIVVNRPTVTSTLWGRGLSVVGGQNVTFRDINVANTNAAGVYIATEGAPYYTYSVDNVEVIGGAITGANTNPAVVHGAVVVYSGNAGQAITDVTVSGLTISNTVATAQRNVAILNDAGNISRVALRNIALRTTKLTPLTLFKVPAGSYSTSGWTLDSKTLTAL